MGKRRASYVAMPAPRTEEGQRRFLVMQRVQAGELSVSAGARELGISRVRFQTLLHRTLEAMVSAIEPKAAGRPAMDAHGRELRLQNERLQRETERMARRLEQMEQILELAADVMSRRIAKSRGRKAVRGSRGGKSSSQAAAARPEASSDGEDPDRETCEDAAAMTQLGLRQDLVASLLAVSPRTVRRWRRRISLGHRLRERRRAHIGNLDPQRRRTAQDLVRRLHGLVGAESIRRATGGISRRQAAAIKAQTLTDMERERKRRSCRVTVTRPGVMRGFDAIYARTEDGWRFPLVAADAAVPFRTSVLVAATAATENVCRALRADLERNGAPLVLRLDRARAHDTAPVAALLAAYRVLTLHGPPHCARYYGQLERQNREHRAWLDACGPLRSDSLQTHCDEMIRSLSFEWRRPTLAWRTAAEVWSESTPVDEDRDALREEVDENSEHLIEQGIERTLAMRLAIEKALIHRGYLRFESWTDC